jgi:hypothetical protein
MHLMRGAVVFSLLIAAAATTNVAFAQGDPSVIFDQPCYTPGDAITETGSGFSPNAQIFELASFSSEDNSALLGALSAPIVAADATGAFTRRLDAPSLRRPSDRRENAFSSFTDQANPAVPAFAQWTLSGWDLRIDAWHSGKGRPGKSMRIDTWGWVGAGDTLFAHYFRAAKPVKTVRIGGLTGPCGDLNVKRRQFPFRSVKPGRWTVYFSATRVLDKANDPWMVYKLAVGKSRAHRSAAGRRTSKSRHAAS